MNEIITDPHTTRNLVHRAQRGDRGAFDELMRKYAPRLKTVVEVRLGNWLRQRVEAEDLVQETIARALESVERFQWQGKESFRLWLEGIAGNLIREAVKNHRRPLGISIPRFTPEATSPSRQARREERFDRLQDALDGLSEDHKKVILLARIQGLKIVDIAQRLNRSTGAVKTLLFRAMQELKKSFGDTESFHLPGRSLENRGGEDVDIE